MQDLGGVGRVLAGKYRVEYVLGRGGMGVVVAALDLTTGTRVALKFLLPQTLNRPDAVPRFLREARAAARLRSEHVARVSEVGTLEWGAPYLVMELLSGSDLHRTVKVHGPLAPAEAVEYVRQACEAIAEAHALGIVHRDLKAENLFLTRREDGSPWIKVLDFGISKAALDDAAESALSSMTRTDMVMGSPQYMSPEQLRSTKDVDARADVWSLGVVLYELTTGAFPFEADTLVDLMSRIIGAAPIPPRKRREEIPIELEALILRCLEKDAARRYTNGAELSVALSALLRGGGEPLVRTLQTSVPSTADASRTEARSDPTPRTQTASTWDRNAPKKAVSRSGRAAFIAAFGAVIAAVIAALWPRGEPAAEPGTDAAVAAATHAALASSTATTPVTPSSVRVSAPEASTPPPVAAVSSATAATSARSAPQPRSALAPAPSARVRRPVQDVFSKRKW